MIEMKETKFLKASVEKDLQIDADLTEEEKLAKAEDRKILIAKLMEDKKS